MMTSASCGLIAVYWLDLGVAGFFSAVAAGFCVYAALLVRAVFSVRSRFQRARHPGTEWWSMVSDAG